MATKSFDAALDFLPEGKAAKRGPGIFGMIKTIFEAFEEGRVAEARYRELIAHGATHEAAARKVFDETIKH